MDKEISERFSRGSGREKKGGRFFPGFRKWQEISSRQNFDGESDWLRELRPTKNFAFKEGPGITTRLAIGPVRALARNGSDSGGERPP